MAKDEKPRDRPVAIRITGKSRDNVFVNPVVHGDIDGVRIEDEATGNEFIGYKHINQSEQPKEGEGGNNATDKHWYKKPIGVIGLGVAVGILVAAALWAVKHYFP